MFPITCNAIGDIIAVVQLVRDIVEALNDARGAAEEYKQFVHVLTALGTVMEAVYNLARDSQDATLREAVLAEMGRCCTDINSAHNSLSGFEKLAGTSARSSRDTARGVLTKLRWHFLRAADAEKYAKRFSESHQRLNTYIGLLGHQLMFQRLEEQRLDALQAAQNHHRAILQSSDEIKALAFSAFQQGVMQSRQQIAEQVLNRPFFASTSQDRRLASRVQRVTDMIFDHLAPNTPPAQRERFLTSSAPFLVVGAAFLVHNNVSPQWHSTLFVPVICALVVQVMWHQSSTPAHPGFDVGNAIILVDFFGEKITVPSQLCRSSEIFHGTLDLLYSDAQYDAKRFVRLRLYELYLGGTSQLISLSNWSRCVLPGTCLEMGIILAPEMGSVITTTCPYCRYNHDVRKSCEVICPACSSRFRQTMELGTFAIGASSVTGALVLHRRHGTDFETEISKMNASLTSSLSVAQYHLSLPVLPNGAVWLRCSRVHVINLLDHTSYAPEDFQLGSKVLMDALFSEETSGVRRCPGYELWRSYIDLIEIYARSELNDRDLSGMHRYKCIYGGAWQNIGGEQGYDQYFGGPMTVEEKLLTDMAATINTFIEEPSHEGVRRWEELVHGYTSELPSLDESQRVEELLEDHERIGDYLHRLCQYVDSQ